MKLIICLLITSLLWLIYLLLRLIRVIDVYIKAKEGECGK